MNFDGWTETMLPNSAIYGPLVLRTGITLPGGGTITRMGVFQNVPPVAPTGNYVYIGNVGTHPGTVMDDDSFPFTKNAGDAVPNHNNGWLVTGWDDSPLAGLEALPIEFSLSAAYPNPFNPSATIRFDLPEASNVKLTVFDITGREAATLVEGWMDAGHYETVFDGTSLASGVYFYRLTAGDFTSVKKMILMK